MKYQLLVNYLTLTYMYWNVKDAYDDKFVRIDTTLEKLVKSVSDLAMIFYSQRQNNTHNTTPSLVHMKQQKSTTPKQSSIRKTKKASLSKKAKAHNTKCEAIVNEGGLKKKFFEHTITSNDFGLFSNVEPLHYATYDGMTTTIDIPMVHL